LPAAIRVASNSSPTLLLLPSVSRRRRKRHGCSLTGRIQVREVGDSGSGPGSGPVTRTRPGSGPRLGNMTPSLAKSGGGSQGGPLRVSRRRGACEPPIMMRRRDSDDSDGSDGSKGPEDSMTRMTRMTRKIPKRPSLPCLPVRHAKFMAFGRPKRRVVRRRGCVCGRLPAAAGAAAAEAAQRARPPCAGLSPLLSESPSPSLSL
jgi:hypothetical protein